MKTKIKTQELLYFLLWSCEQLSRPTFRNVSESFEAWAYRNGFHRQLAELERLELVESQRPADGRFGNYDRVLRLTEPGRLEALGGRDPEVCWKRSWDGQWRLALFDLPVARSTERDRLRRYLRHRGFGYLQNSVWISPGPLEKENETLTGCRINVESFILLEARPSAGETDQDLVAGAWDFEEINASYAMHLETLAARPVGQLHNESDARAFYVWAGKERTAWLTAVSQDPLLPERLLPEHYLGRQAWFSRKNTLAQAAEQANSFRWSAPDK